MGLNIIQPKVSEQQKTAYLFAAICKEYQENDKITNTVNIPYFMRARNRVDSIIARGELDKEFKNYMRKEKEHGKERKQESKI